MNADDPKLSALIRQARVSPPLPPRFQVNVWRRIEDAEAPAESLSWLESLAALVLRPRFVCSMAVALVLAGALLGAHRGAQDVRHEEQARYLTSVVPNYLH